jgi:hypothetical protein
MGYNESEESIDRIAKELSQSTNFDVNKPELYYYVREP